MFCFAAIIQHIKKALYDFISDEDLINLIIADIVKTQSLENQNGELLYLDKGSTSIIMNRKANVPEKLRSALAKESGSVEGIEKHISKFIIPQMIPEMREEICRELIQLINKQENVPKHVRNEILSYGETENGARLLAVLIRYSFMIPNKQVSEKKQQVDNSEQKIFAPYDLILKYLHQPEDWVRSSSISEDIRYYKFAPEYTIEHSYETEDARDGYEYYLFAQRDTTPHWMDIKLKYHQTVLHSMQGGMLDGGRYCTPCPEWGVIYPFNDDYESVIYKYFIDGSCEEIVHTFYYNANDPEERYSHSRFIDSILMFQNEDEKERFEEFASYRWDEYKERNLSFSIPPIEGITERASKHYEKVFYDVRLLQRMLEEFRSGKRR